MALMIPTTRSTMPNQDAPTNVNSAEQFGSKVAAATNMPNVQNGQGGFVTQFQSAPTQIERERAPNTVVEYPNYAGMIGQVAGAIDQVISDIDKKEEALRRANETVDFNKAQLDYHNSALEAQHNAKLMIQSGDLKDEVDAAGYYNDKMTQLRDEHFPKGRFSTLEIETKSKMLSDEVVGKYNQNFKEQVVIPAQTDRFLRTNSEIEGARTVQGYNEGLTTAPENRTATLKAGLNAIKEQYGPNSGIAAVMTPSQITAATEKSTLNYISSHLNGYADRGIDKNGKQDSLVSAQQKLKNMRENRAFITGDADISAALGTRFDETIKNVDGSIVQLENYVMNEQDRRQRKAEAAAARAEKHRADELEADVAQNGMDSKFMREWDKLSASDRVIAGKGVETYERRQKTTLGLAEDFRKNNAGKQDSLVNPSTDDKKKADAYFELSTPQLKQMNKEQQDLFVSKNFFKVGVVPTQIRDETKHALNSSDPLNVQKAFDAMKVINDASPKALASAFSDSEKAMFIEYRAGKDLGKIITDRDKNAELRQNKKPEEFEKEYNQGAYRAAGKLVKNEAEFKEKIASTVASQSKGTFEFGDVVVADDVKEYLSDKVKTYVAHGIPFTKSVEAASKDVSLTAGKSGVTGNKKSIVLFSPEVMTGKETKDVQKDLKPYVDAIRIDKRFINRPEEDFFLQPTPRTTKDNPVFEVWVKDKDGHAARVLGNNYQPVYVPLTRKDK